MYWLIVVIFLGVTPDGLHNYRSITLDKFHTEIECAGALAEFKETEQSKKAVRVSCIKAGMPERPKIKI